MAKRIDPLDHFEFLSIRIGRLISKQKKQKLEQMGMDFPPSCIGILADLWLQDGLNQKELGACTIKAKSSVNKMLLALESHQMIRREIDPKDKRNKRIFLTAKAKRLHEHLHNESKSLEKELMKGLEKKEIEIAKKVLQELYHHLTLKTHKEELNG